MQICPYKTVGIAPTLSLTLYVSGVLWILMWNYLFFLDRAQNRLCGKRVEAELTIIIEYV